MFLNPACADDLSMCQCAADLICNSATATVCDAGCKCGSVADPCADGTPICDQTDPDNLVCAACSVEGSADGSEKGNCPGDTDKCHSDGARAVCIDSVGDGNAATPHSGCTTEMPKCTPGDPNACGPAD